MKRFLLRLVLCGFIPLVAARSYATHAKINSDLVLEIDGKKVFVIGFSAAPPADGKAPNGKNAIQELADAGATFVRSGPLGEAWDAKRFVAERKMQDAAARYGMHCWLALREAAAVKKPGDAHEQLLRKLIATFKNHPGMGVWKGADEPEWGKEPLPPLERTYTLLKQLDPYHPLAIIEAPRGTVESLKKYNPVCDILGTDIYPVSVPPGKHSQWVKTNSEISMVGDYTREMVEVSEGKKSVWMTLQIFWSGVNPPKNKVMFPTFAEERFMTYQAIINGARGITYFGGAAPASLNEEDKRLGWNWRFWNEVLRPVIQEIGTKSSLYPALVAPNSTLPIQVKGDGVEFCVREVDGQVFVLACKRGKTTEQISFSGLPENITDGEVLFEAGRTVEVKTGQFADSFAPFAVHVYRFKKS